MPFNPSKTNCVTFDQSFLQHKHCHLEGMRLEDQQLRLVSFCLIMLTVIQRFALNQLAKHSIPHNGLAYELMVLTLTPLLTYSILLSVLYWNMVQKVSTRRRKNTFFLRYPYKQSRPVINALLLPFQQRILANVGVHIFYFNYM